MADLMQADVEQLYLEFLNEKTYQHRVTLFDKHFGLVPFTFTFFDADLSWFHTGSKTLELIDIFNKENDPDANFYQKSFVVGNHTVNFNIKPVTREQRSFFNRSIVRRFLQDKASLYNLIEKELEAVSDPLAYLNSRILRMNKMFKWISQKLNEPVNHMALKVKFLGIFYQGYTSFFEDERTLNIKRRFVELYLYTQGLLFLNYQNALLEKLQSIKITHVVENIDHPFLKLVMMQKLGIIEHLRKNCLLNDKEQIQKHVAKALCLIMNGNADCYRLIIEYLQTGGVNPDAEPAVSEQHLTVLINELKYFNTH
jgi:hypothetical protein